MMSDVTVTAWIISLMPIELFHTYSKDLGRDVLGNVKKETNKQTTENKNYTMRHRIRK